MHDDEDFSRVGPPVDGVAPIRATAEPRTGEVTAADAMADAAEMLWIVLANVSEGDWTKQTPEWQEAAARWRDNYFAALKQTQPAGAVLPPADSRQTVPAAERNEWRLDDDGALDDVVVDDVVTFRLERMNHDHIWGCVYHRDGSRTAFDICGDRAAKVSLTHEHERLAEPSAQRAVLPPADPWQPLLNDLRALIDKWKQQAADREEKADSLDMLREPERCVKLRTAAQELDNCAWLLENLIANRLHGLPGPPAPPPTQEPPAQKNDDDDDQARVDNLRLSEGRDLPHRKTGDT